MRCTIKRIYNLYQKVLFKYPYATQAVQTSIMMSAGDVLAQTVVEKREVRNINWGRTFEFTCLGFFFVGPAVTVWYRTMNTYIGEKGTVVALKKVVCDQLLFAPVMLLAVLSILGYLRTRDVDKGIQKMKDEYKDVLLANYKVWPMVNLVNFYFIPLHYQVLYVQTVALCWNTYISWKTQHEDSDISK